MPAAAVIPAPIAYIKVVAVKKLVVGFLHVARLLLMEKASRVHRSVSTMLGFTTRSRAQMVYLEEIRVFQAGLAGIR